MAMGRFDSSTVVLVPRQMVMSQRIDMALFQIVGSDFREVDFDRGKRGIRVKIVMKRKNNKM